MKVALIAPDSMIDQARKGDMHFILTHIRESNYLPNVFAKEQLYKMLDNGCYEYGYPMDFDEYFDLAKMVKADEVVCPDYFQERKQTYAVTKEFLSVASDEYKYTAVPQAKTPLEWIKAYKQMIKLDGIDVISIPIWIQKYYRARPAVVGHLIKRGYWDRERDHHLLGLDNYGELFAYPVSAIRSVDTSLPFSLTHSNIWESCFVDIEHARVPLNRKPFAPMQMRMLDKHIAELLNAASYS